MESSGLDLNLGFRAEGFREVFVAGFLHLQYVPQPATIFLASHDSAKHGIMLAQKPKSCCLGRTCLNAPRGGENQAITDCQVLQPYEAKHLQCGSITLLMIEGLSGLGFRVKGLWLSRSAVGAGGALEKDVGGGFGVDGSDVQILGLFC